MSGNIAHRTSTETSGGRMFEQRAPVLRRPREVGVEAVQARLKIGLGTLYQMIADGCLPQPKWTASGPMWSTEVLP